MGVDVGLQDGAGVQCELQGNGKWGGVKGVRGLAGCFGCRSAAAVLQDCTW